MIIFGCPHCGASLKVQPALAGRTGKCVHCHQSITVPKALAAAPQRAQTLLDSPSPKLRSCPDCGQSVSIRAPACPRCACPIQAPSDVAKASHRPPPSLPLSKATISPIYPPSVSATVVSLTSPNQRRMAPLLTVSAVALAAIAITVGSVVVYKLISQNFAERARQLAFTQAIEAAEKAGLDAPDRDSLDEADRLATLDSEKARVQKVETAIEIASPVATFIKAYNQKDINLMLKQLDHRIETSVEWADTILDATVPKAARLWVDSKKVLDLVPWLAPIAGNQVGTSQLVNAKIHRPSISGESAELLVTLDHSQTIIQQEHASHLTVLFDIQREPQPIGWRIHWAKTK